MELAFFVLGFLFIVAGMRDNVGALFGALEQDLVGPGGFLIWAGLLVSIWVGGEVLRIPGPAKLLMGLLIFVYIVKNPTAVSTAANQLSSATAAAPSTTSVGEATRAGGGSGQGAGGSGQGAGGIVGKIGGAITGGKF